MPFFGQLRRVPSRKAAHIRPAGPAQITARFGHRIDENEIHLLTEQRRSPILASLKDRLGQPVQRQEKNDEFSSTTNAP